MLLDLVQKSLKPEKYSEIESELLKPGRIVHGLTNSAKSFLLANLLEKSETAFIFLVQNFHDAQIYFQEIQNLSSKPVYNFLCQEISPYDQINSDIGVLNKQLEIIESWKKPGGSLTIMPFKSLSQLYMGKELLTNSSLVIDKNFKLSPEELAKKLVTLGYKREFNVENRGQFSQRGDIFDIYPIIGEPVRLEFFGDDVESLRAFNTNSQRSIKAIDSFIVHPRYLVLRTDDDGLEEKVKAEYDNQLKALKGEAKDTLESLRDSELTLASENNYWEGVEYYREFLDQSSANLFDYLPKSPFLVFDEWEDLSYKSEEWEKLLKDQHKEGIKSGKVMALKDILHFPLGKIRESLENYPKKLYLQTMTEALDLTGNGSLSYEVISYPAEKFASKIDMFIDYVRTALREKKQVLIFSEQPQRVLGILKEWDVAAIYFEKGLSFDELSSPKYENTVWIQRDGTHEGFKLPELNLEILTDRELFGRSRQAVARQKKVIGARRDDESISDISQLRVNDYVVHYKHGVGRYKGTEQVELFNNTAKQVREYLIVEYADESRLLIPVDQVNLLSRFNATGDSKPKLSKLGGNEWDRTKKKVKKSVKKIAEDLINLYALRAKQTGYVYPHDTPWQIEMEDAFPYTETPDQLRAIEDVKSDMQDTKLLDRLICGDAGFGKTEVILRSVFKAVMDGKQVAILVPTTVLAQQHFNVFSDRYAPYPIRTGLLCRFKTAKEQREVVDKLKIGECDVVIGTHRLLQRDIQFKNLGMLIIDEEQRFGVSHKEKLKSLRADLDVITMSATPIPRTLHMALSGAKDISLIKTAPVNRKPVKTFVGEYKKSLIRNSILHELERGGQVFFLHNRVETIEKVAYDLQELIPEASIGIAHGQMSDRDLEDVMFSFINQEFQVLVCTTIIETGLDISNANTIIIDRADTMGLSQLYQLRGRVGRSDAQAYAYLLYNPGSEISETARKRLRAIRELTNLGSGYQIALRDMEIRGVGNILGAEQHGHMLSVGFDLYCKLLGDTVQELQGTGFESELESTISVDLNVTAFFPEYWLNDAEQRMMEYKRLSIIRSENELEALISEWEDRFGRMPNETKNLTEIVRIKLLAKKAGVTSISQDAQGIKLLANMRLQAWLQIQKSLPEYLQSQTVFKSGAVGSPNAQPYIVIKTTSMNPDQQLESIKEIVTKMLEGN